jgi:metallo-beta-lactamase family protein
VLTPEIIHHGAVDGVTGSCHQVILPDGQSILIDCGLFQGAETASDGASADRLEIKFPVKNVAALVVTHVHIDHVGRIPYLLAAGFKGPIICTQASAHLLPMVLEDALKIGFTRNQRLIGRFLKQIRLQIVPLPYKQWHEVVPGGGFNGLALKVKLSPAEHILGSAYVEVDVKQNKYAHRILFSGDLGAPYTPLLPAPGSPYGADTLILESTYGDRLHENRRDRRWRLQQLLLRTLANRGSVLIPAFSIGRTQELLYELEDIIHRNRQKQAAPQVIWDDLDILIDSPLAADFTQGYLRLREHWDEEAKRRLSVGRHPLAFDQLTTIDSHATHLQTVDYLAKTARPAIVIAASGMCSGGRIVNYLKAMLGDARHDLLFVGYQAAGTPGRIIQQYGPRGGYVEIDGKRYEIRAGVHTISGYSAHADQKDLINFIGRMRRKPQQVRLVHGDEEAKQTLAVELRKRHRDMDVSVP